jgi:hypothetical protein
MILIIEIIFLFAGLYALFTAKMPSWIVGKGYKAEGNKVRLIGALMALLLPGVFCLGLTVGFLGGYADFDPTSWVSVLEFGTVIVVALIVTFALRSIRVPDVPAEISISNNIEPK